MFHQHSHLVAFHLGKKTGPSGNWRSNPCPSQTHQRPHQGAVSRHMARKIYQWPVVRAGNHLVDIAIENALIRCQNAQR